MLKANHCNVIDTSSFINDFLERTEHNGQPVEPGWESRLDIDANEVVIKGSKNTRVPNKQVGHCPEFDSTVSSNRESFRKSPS